MQIGNSSSISQMLMQLQGATSTQSSGSSSLFRQQVSANTPDGSSAAGSTHACTGATLSTTTITVMMQFSGTSSCSDTGALADKTDGNALTELFMKRLKEAFTAADENGDGKLDKNEFAKFLKNLTGSQLTSGAQIDNLFTKMDNDGDGNVTMNELTTHFDDLRDLAGGKALTDDNTSTAISQTISALSHLMQQMQQAYAQNGATSMSFFASVSTAA